MLCRAAGVWKTVHGRALSWASWGRKDETQRPVPFCLLSFGCEGAADRRDTWRQRKTVRQGGIDRMQPASKKRAGGERGEIGGREREKGQGRDVGLSAVHTKTMWAKRKSNKRMEAQKHEAHGGYGR